VLLVSALHSVHFVMLLTDVKEVEVNEGHALSACVWNTEGGGTCASSLLAHAGVISTPHGKAACLCWSSAG
jgi:hypothetical protein